MSEQTVPRMRTIYIGVPGPRCIEVQFLYHHGESAGK